MRRASGAREDDEPSTREEILRRAGPFLGLGSTFLGSVAGCLLLGWWIDRAAGTAPLWTLIGAFIGIVAGFYLFFKTVLGAREGSEGGDGKHEGGGSGPGGGKR